MKLHKYASTYSIGFDVYTIEFGVQVILGHFNDHKKAENYAIECFLTQRKNLPIYINTVFVKHSIEKVVS